MTQSDLLRSMLRALSDIREQGDTYETGDQWDVTVHAGHKSASLTVPHVVRVVLKGDFVVLETSKKHQFAVLSSEVYAVGQEPSERESKNRRTGFL
jgi:hypothetical protein